MADFRFRGRIPASKSLLNRALIVKSHSPSPLMIRAESDAEDVVFLRKALGKIEDGREFYLGDGGTTLRFFALRVSRESGRFGLKVSSRLFSRPQGALKEILQQLGVDFQIGENAYVIQGRGWNNPSGAIKVPAGESSQFASALILNAWNLDFPLEIQLEGELRSKSYLEMTLQMCRDAGMEIQETDRGYRIPADQKPQLSEMKLEPDLSSVFSLAANAALNGEMILEDFPSHSTQPDVVFVELLRKMGADVFVRHGALEVRKALSLKALDQNLGQSPDLVPVLSVLCAFAEGRSRLWGAPQLRYKESDRIRSTAQLLRQMKVSVTELEDGLEIEGNPRLSPQEFSFDPDSDHRLAMAAGLLISRGWPIRVTDPQVVRKSFPEFWSLIRSGPHLLMGHRGVGKTQLLERWREKGFSVMDLDAEIERRTGQKIFDFFRDRGEEIFRQTEVAVLSDLLKRASAQDWIALGAGVRLEEVPDIGEKIWIRRETDHEGRVFLDRPRLDPGSDPLAEFRDRARLREKPYERRADRIYTMPEGLKTSDEIEDQILLGWNFEVGGCLTLFPSGRRSLPRSGVDFYELRDDLLDPDELRTLFYKLDPAKVIYSVRKNKNIPREILDSAAWIDWGLDEFYPEKEFVQENAQRLILSSHGTMSDALLDFRIYQKAPVHLKLCPLVESFEDLKAGHEWWAQDPVNRSFLPRSASGRWGWYRLWMKGRMKVNFWREGKGSSLDQPTLAAWLSTPARADRFAAVLGHPVAHSWTPQEQRRFFAEIGVPVWAIEVREEEWRQAFSFLTDLGLRYAAVTSPLKGLAARSSKASARAKELGSVNTLLWDAMEWKGENTDLEGLQAAVHSLPEGPLAIWGGGGTLGVLGKVLPEASAFSSTGGHLRQGSKPLSGPPRVVIWAAPRGSDLKMPPDDWKPQVVLDLNYKEDSPGREYALRVQAEYRSGEVMFRAQAAAQREWWKSDVESRKGEG